MNLGRAITITCLAGILLLVSGCKKKNPNIPPPQSQAPTLSQPEIAVGSPPPALEEPPSQTIPNEQAQLPQLPDTKTPKPTPRRTRNPRRAATPPVAPQPAPAKKEPDKTAQTPTPPQGQLTASLSQDAALHQKLTTAQLIDSTESTLKGINRTLSTDEQAMVQHIRNFIQQSKSASSDGDLERAYNLALKAHLLSDELTKR